MRTRAGSASDARRVVGLAAGGLLFAACEAGPAPLDWEIEFATPDLRARAALVDARILRGGCDGSEVFGVEVRAGARMTPAPPSLPAGTWGFVAAAHDASCLRFAYDCVVVELPGERRVRDTLAATEEVQVCVPPQCREGGCRGDAGSEPLPDVPMPDASVDAGPVDAPAIDAFSLLDGFSPIDAVSPVDAARRVDSDLDAACAATESRCTDGIDEDCDGLRDCADPTCSGMAVCDRCAGVVCPDCQACTAATGDCDPVAGPCAGGACVAGACCSGCEDRGLCLPGTTDAQCGSGGGACAACGECRLCTGGSCVIAPDGFACAAGAGLCRAGACCTGCFSGSTCTPGAMTGQCGFGGASCNTVCACTSGAAAGGTCAGGESCGAPLDVSAIGTHEVPIDTCGRADDVAAPCGRPGGPDVVLRGDWPMSGARYDVRVPVGWVITYVQPGSCGALDSGCYTSHGITGSMGMDTHAAWGIERQDGTCGRATVTVTRSM